MTKTSTSVYGYCRVSTDEQSLGIEAQKAAIIDFAAKMNPGRQITKWFIDEGISGGSALEKRLALCELLAIVGSRDKVIVARRDRLARDTFIYLTIERNLELKRAVLLSCDGTGNGEGPEAMLFRTMIAAFAAYDRAVIRGRNTAALKVKKKNGEAMRTAPYGYRKTGGIRAPEGSKKKWTQGPLLEQHPDEFPVLVRMRKMGAYMKHYRIAKMFNKEGVPTRKGQPWTQNLVKVILEKFKPKESDNGNDDQEETQSGDDINHSSAIDIGTDNGSALPTGNDGSTDGATCAEISGDDRPGVQG